MALCIMCAPILSWLVICFGFVSVVPFLHWQDGDADWTSQVPTIYIFRFSIFRIHLNKKKSMQWQMIAELFKHEHNKHNFKHENKKHIYIYIYIPWHHPHSILLNILAAVSPSTKKVTFFNSPPETYKYSMLLFYWLDIYIYIYIYISVDVFYFFEWSACRCSVRSFPHWWGILRFGWGVGLVHALCSNSLPRLRSSRRDASPLLSPCPHPFIEV